MSFIYLQSMLRPGLKTAYLWGQGSDAPLRKQRLAPARDARGGERGARLLSEIASSTSSPHRHSSRPRPQVHLRRKRATIGQSSTNARRASYGSDGAFFRKGVWDDRRNGFEWCSTYKQHCFTSNRTHYSWHRECSPIHDLQGSSR